MGNNLTTSGQSATLNSRRTKSAFDRRQTGRNVADQNNQNSQIGIGKGKIISASNVNLLGS